jgi:DNA-directed RNA polymerase specialized sigma24 family protein
VSADTLAYAIRALDNCLRTSERRARRCDSTDDEADKGAGDPPRPRAKMLADSHTPADDRLAEHQEVRGLLGSLAAEDAQLLERVVAGESREDLAAELGLKRCAIDKRYSRLRAALRAEAVR